jgi:hypothetical protein
MISKNFLLAKLPKIYSGFCLSYQEKKKVENILSKAVKTRKVQLQ